MSTAVRSIRMNPKPNPIPALAATVRVLALAAFRAPADQIFPQVDVIQPYLKHRELWLKNGALMVLANVITDERCFEKVIPPKPASAGSRSTPSAVVGSPRKRSKAPTTSSRPAASARRTPPAGNPSSWS